MRPQPAVPAYRREARLRLNGNVGFMKMMKHGCIMRLLKVAGGASLLIALLMYLQRKDYPPRRTHEARDMARAEFGSTYPTSNEYCIVFGFLQGCTCYYRLDSTPEATRHYIARKHLTLVTDKNAIQQFKGASPYWWQPEKSTNVAFYGYSPRNCTFSTDIETGRCHILLHGG